MLIGFIGTGKAQQLEVAQLSDKDYALRVTSPVPLSIEDAQAGMLGTAIELCKGRTPVFGQYEFANAQALKPETTTSDIIGFQLIQHVSCRDEPANSPEAADSAPYEGGGLSDVDLQVRIKTESIKFLSHRAGGDLDAAYAMLGETMRGFSTREAWLERNASFRNEIGEVESVQVVKVTVYKNPANAPQPGTYIAADYDNQYSELPAHCGYLMWYQTGPETFEIIREESTVVSRDVLDSVTNASLEELKRGAGCVSP